MSSLAAEAHKCTPHRMLVRLDSERNLSAFLLLFQIATSNLSKMLLKPFLLRWDSNSNLKQMHHWLSSKKELHINDRKEKIFLSQPFKLLQRIPTLFPHDSISRGHMDTEIWGTQGKCQKENNHFFETYRACVLTLSNALEWPRLKEHWTWAVGGTSVWNKLCATWSRV